MTKAGVAFSGTIASPSYLPPVQYGSTAFPMKPNMSVCVFSTEYMYRGAVLAQLD